MHLKIQSPLLEPINPSLSLSELPDSPDTDVTTDVKSKHCKSITNTDDLEHLGKTRSEINAINDTPAPDNDRLIILV